MYEDNLKLIFNGLNKCNRSMFVIVRHLREKDKIMNDLIEMFIDDIRNKMPYEAFKGKISPNEYEELLQKDMIELNNHKNVRLSADRYIGFETIHDINRYKGDTFRGMAIQGIVNMTDTEVCDEVLYCTLPIICSQRDGLKYSNFTQERLDSMKPYGDIK